MVNAIAELERRLREPLRLAIAGAVAAGQAAGGYATYAEAQKAMTGLKARVFKPNPAAHAVG